MRAVKALASLCICADMPEPSLLADALSIEISCTLPYILNRSKKATPGLFAIYIQNYADQETKVYRIVQILDNA